MTGKPRLFPCRALPDAPGRNVAFLAFLLAFALVHASAQLGVSSAREGFGPERILCAQSAPPMERETAPEKRLEDSGPPRAAPPVSESDNPLSRAAFFLKPLPLDQDMAIRARAAFNRLIVRILSPLSRRSWG